EEYLAFERGSELRHEYLHGEVRPVFPSNENHSLICVSTSSALFDQIKDLPCVVMAIQMRVKAGNDAHVYPDVVVVCGKSQLEDEQKDTLLNPVVIIEVLTSESEGYDRGKKFLYYRQIESLREYVLIAQDEPRVERFLRQDGDGWLHTVVTGLDAHIQLESIGCILSLKDAYRKVKFEPTEPEE
ncbi:MAG: Uma2 family endonuclease, partial [Anaerolineae bacterium]|nr:Uma2 family endonuclease [Anaerolineae bacterium]